MATRKYNPKKITASYTGSVGGNSFAFQFLGFMDGTFLTADYDEDAVTKHVGSQGDATFILNANRGASVTVMLVQGSPTNDELSKLVPNADLNYMPVGVLNFKDLNGTTVFESADAVIKRRAKVEFGKEVTGREWVFDCGHADLKVGSGEDV